MFCACCWPFQFTWRCEGSVACAKRLLQAGAAQGLQHPHGNAFQRGKTAPLADQRDGIAQPPQPQRHRRTGRAGAQNHNRRSWARCAVQGHGNGRCRAATR